MEKTDYDKIIRSQFKDIAIINYGIINGNETSFLLKQDKMVQCMVIKINI